MNVLFLHPPRCKRKLSIFTVIYLYILFLWNLKYMLSMQCKSMGFLCCFILHWLPLHEQKSLKPFLKMFYSAEGSKSSWGNGDRIYVFGVKCRLNAVRRLSHFPCYHLLMLLSSCFTLFTYLLFCSWDSHSELILEKILPSHSSAIQMFSLWCLCIGSVYE